MRRLTWAIAFFATLAALGPVTRSASAQAPADEAAYRSTIDEAVREFSAGRFDEARALFRRAHEISPNARTLRGLGMTAFELRAYVQAIRELQAALADRRKPLEGELRAKVEALLVKSRKFVGVLRLELDPKNASVLIDGKPPTFEDDGTLLLDAGTHVISATAPEHKATNVRVLVEGDTVQTVRVPLESTAFQQSLIAPIDAEQVASQKDQPEKPSAVEPPKAEPEQSGGRSATTTWAIGTLIGAGTFGATAAIFWLMGDGQYEDLEESCAPACNDAQIEDSGVKTSDVLTNVFLGLSAASLAASGVLFVVGASGSGESASAAPAARVQVGPLGASVSGSF